MRKLWAFRLPLIAFMVWFSVWPFFYDPVVWHKGLDQILVDQGRNLFYLFLCTLGLLIVEIVGSLSFSHGSLIDYLLAVSSKPEINKLATNMQRIANIEDYERWAGINPDGPKPSNSKDVFNPIRKRRGA